MLAVRAKQNSRRLDSLNNDILHNDNLNIVLQ
jgi:hypothetical protein